MSRAANHLRQLIDDGLQEREHRRWWIAEVRRLYPWLRADEKTWLAWGHETPEMVIYELVPGYQPDDDDWEDELWDYGDEPDQQWYDHLYDLDEWEPETWLFDSYDDDWDRACEPTHDYFGGQLYPIEDVEDAKKTLDNPQRIGDDGGSTKGCG